MKRIHQLIEHVCIVVLPVLALIAAWMGHWDTAAYTMSSACFIQLSRLEEKG